MITLLWNRHFFLQMFQDLHQTLAGNDHLGFHLPIYFPILRVHPILAGLMLSEILLYFYL